MSMMFNTCDAMIKGKKKELYGLRLWRFINVCCVCMCDTPCLCLCDTVCMALYVCVCVCVCVCMHVCDLLHFPPDPMLPVIHSSWSHRHPFDESKPHRTSPVRPGAFDIHAPAGQRRPFQQEEPRGRGGAAAGPGSSSVETRRQTP